MLDPFKEWMKWELRYIVFCIIMAVACLIVMWVVVELAVGG